MFLRINFLLKIFIIFIISIILSLLSCDVLTKMNKQEWEEQNLDDEEKKIYIYVTGYSNNGTDDDFLTIKYDEQGNLHWIKRHDNSNNDQAFGLAIDNSGNVFVGGMTGLSSDHYLLKYNSNGNEIWNIWNSLSPNYESFTSLTCDDNNNIYATGYFYNPIVGDLHEDYCIMKYDPSNNLLWGEIFQWANESIDERGYGITYDNNNLYVAGYSIQSGDTTNDICLIKYDLSGNILNTIYYPNTNDTTSEEARDVAADKYGNIFVVGYRNLTGGNFDCILLKYDSSLNLIWNKTIDIDTDDRGEGVAVDSAGNVYIAIHSGSGPGNFDCYTIKYNQLGNEEWRKQYGSGGVNDQIWDIAVDPRGSSYVVGNSNNDYLIIKYDFYGNEKWKISFDGGNNDEARAVCIGDK